MKNQKVYETCKIEVLTFATSDAITTSAGLAEYSLENEKDNFFSGNIWN